MTLWEGKQWKLYRIKTKNICINKLYMRIHLLKAFLSFELLFSKLYVSKKYFNSIWSEGRKYFGVQASEPLCPFLFPTVGVNSFATSCHRHLPSHNLGLRLTLDLKGVVRPLLFSVKDMRHRTWPQPWGSDCVICLHTEVPTRLFLIRFVFQTAIC